MAATCLDIVTYALRQARVIGPGRSPKGAEADEGMIALQALYDEWRTNGMFGELRDVYLTADDVAEEGVRYYTPAGVTVADATNDYIGCDNETVRQPRDLALYEVVQSDGTQTAKLYDRTAWVDLLDLTLDSIAPLSGRSAYGLAAALCVSGAFASVFGGEPSATVIALGSRFVGNLSAKRGSTQDRHHYHGEYM